VFSPLLGSVWEPGSAHPTPPQSTIYWLGGGQEHNPPVLCELLPLNFEFEQPRQVSGSALSECEPTSAPDGTTWMQQYCSNIEQTASNQATCSNIAAILSKLHQIRQPTATNCLKCRQTASNQATNCHKLPQMQANCMKCNQTAANVAMYCSKLHQMINYCSKTATKLQQM
jgi:hypothetical protein